MIPFATFICAANQMPKSYDKSSAFIDRLAMVPMLRQHTEADAARKLKYKISTVEQRSGVLNHALRGMHEILDNPVFAEPASGKEQKANLNEYYQVDTIKRLAIQESEVRLNYEAWVKEEEISSEHILNKTKWRAVLKAMGINREQRRLHGSRVYFLTGLSLK